MSSSSYGNGIQMQSLGQGLAAAASMYATLSMQGEKLAIERTKADNRRLEFNQGKVAEQEEESTEVVKEALAKEEEEKEDDLSAYGQVVGQTPQNNFSFRSQSIMPTQSMDNGKSLGYIGKALKRSERNDFARNSSTGGSF